MINYIGWAVTRKENRGKCTRAEKVVTFYRVATKLIISQYFIFWVRHCHRRWQYKMKYLAKYFIDGKYFVNIISCKDIFNYSTINAYYEYIPFVVRSFISYKFTTRNIFESPIFITSIRLKAMKKNMMFNNKNR